MAHKIQTASISKRLSITKTGSKHIACKSSAVKSGSTVLAKSSKAGFSRKGSQRKSANKRPMVETDGPGDYESDL